MPTKNMPMIIFVTVNIKKIYKKQKKYPWPRLKVCPKCKASNLWGHGFVMAYFDGFYSAIFLRRYRCPNCNSVFRMRPEGYFYRFQASKETIRSSIISKITKGRWLKAVCRTRQWHWFKGLIRRVKAFLGDTWQGSLVEAFDDFVYKKINPVSRSFKLKIFSVCIDPTEE